MKLELRLEIGREAFQAEGILHVKVQKRETELCLEKVFKEGNVAGV